MPQPILETNLHTTMHMKSSNNNIFCKWNFFLNICDKFQYQARFFLEAAQGIHSLFKLNSGTSEVLKVKFEV